MQGILEYFKQHVARKEQLEKIGKVFGGVLIIALGVLVFVKLLEWGNEFRENRRMMAVRNISPDRLIARCG